MRALFLLLSLTLPLFGISQLTPKQESKIDSLQQVIATTTDDTIIVNSWMEWDKIIYITDQDLHLDLNQKIDSVCTINLKSKPNKKEVNKYLKSKALALNNIGTIHINQGNYAKSIHYFARSRKICEEIGDKQGVASSLNNIGTIHINQGNYAKAIAYYTHSLRIDEEIGNKEGIATSLNNVGNIYNYQGDYVRAIDYFTQSLKIHEEIGDKQGVASSLNNIGNIYHYQGDYAKAIDCLAQSVKIHEEIGDKQGVASSLNNIGII